MFSKGGTSSSASYGSLSSSPSYAAGGLGIVVTVTKDSGLWNTAGLLSSTAPLSLASGAPANSNANATSTPPATSTFLLSHGKGMRGHHHSNNVNTSSSPMLYFSSVAEAAAYLEAVLPPLQPSPAPPVAAMVGGGGGSLLSPTTGGGSPRKGSSFAVAGAASILTSALAAAADSTAPLPTLPSTVATIIVTSGHYHEPPLLFRRPFVRVTSETDAIPTVQCTEGSVVVSEQCHFAGIKFMAPDALTPAVLVTAKEPLFTRCTFQSLCVDNSACPMVMECGFAQSTGTGLVISGSAGGLYKQCTFTSNHLYGACIDSDRSPVLAHCRFSMSGRGGVIIQGARSTPKLLTCIVQDATNIGTYDPDALAANAKAVMVAGTACDRAGVLIANGASPTLDGCTVFSCEGHGVACYPDGFTPYRLVSTDSFVRQQQSGSSSIGGGGGTGAKGRSVGNAKGSPSSSSSFLPNVYKTNASSPSASSKKSPEGSPRGTASRQQSPSNSPSSLSLSQQQQQSSGTSSLIQIVKCVIRGNEGCGIMAVAPSSRIVTEHNTIVDNKGGGIFHTDDASYTLTFIHGNVAPPHPPSADADGGGDWGSARQLPHQALQGGGAPRSYLARQRDRGDGISSNADDDDDDGDGMGGMGGSPYAILGEGRRGWGGNGGEWTWADGPSSPSSSPLAAAAQQRGPPLVGDVYTSGRIWGNLSLGPTPEPPNSGNPLSKLIGGGGGSGASPAASTTLLSSSVRSNSPSAPLPSAASLLVPTRLAGVRPSSAAPLLSKSDTITANYYFGVRVLGQWSSVTVSNGTLTGHTIGAIVGGEGTLKAFNTTVTQSTVGVVAEQRGTALLSGCGVSTCDEGLVAHNYGVAECSECRFTLNTSVGVTVRDHGRPRVTACVFARNGIAVGAFASAEGSFSRCSFDTSYTAHVVAGRRARTVVKDSELKGGLPSTRAFVLCTVGCGAAAFINNAMSGNRHCPFVRVARHADPLFDGNTFSCAASAHTHRQLAGGGGGVGSTSSSSSLVAAIVIGPHGQGLFTGNTIHGSDGAGVVVRSGAEPTMRGNSITDNYVCGIEVMRGGGGTYERNQIVGNHTYGVLVSGECGGSSHHSPRQQKEEQTSPARRMPAPPTNSNSNSGGPSPQLAGGGGPSSASTLHSLASPYFVANVICGSPIGVYSKSVPMVGVSASLNGSSVAATASSSSLSPKARKLASTFTASAVDTSDRDGAGTPLTAKGAAPPPPTATAATPPLLLFSHGGRFARNLIFFCAVGMRLHSNAIVESSQIGPCNGVGVMVGRWDGCPSRDTPMGCGDGSDVGAALQHPHLQLLRHQRGAVGGSGGPAPCIIGNTVEGNTAGGIIVLTGACPRVSSNVIMGHTSDAAGTATARRSASSTASPEGSRSCSPLGSSSLSLSASGSRGSASPSPSSPSVPSAVAAHPLMLTLNRFSSTMVCDSLRRVVGAMLASTLASAAVASSSSSSVAPPPTAFATTSSANEAAARLLQSFYSSPYSAVTQQWGRVTATPTLAAALLPREDRRSTASRAAAAALSLQYASDPLLGGTANTSSPPLGPLVGDKSKGAGAGKATMAMTMGREKLAASWEAKGDGPSSSSAPTAVTDALLEEWWDGLYKRGHGIESVIIGRGDASSSSSSRPSMAPPPPAAGIVLHRGAKGAFTSNVVSMNTCGVRFDRKASASATGGGWAASQQDGVGGDGDDSALLLSSSPTPSPSLGSMPCRLVFGNCVFRDNYCGVATILSSTSSSAAVGAALVGGPSSTAYYVPPLFLRCTFSFNTVGVSATVVSPSPLLPPHQQQQYSADDHHGDNSPFAFERIALHQCTITHNAKVGVLLSMATTTAAVGGGGAATAKMSAASPHNKHNMSSVAGAANAPQKGRSEGGNGVGAAATTSASSYFSSFVPNPSSPTAAAPSTPNEGSSSSSAAPLAAADGGSAIIEGIDCCWIDVFNCIFHNNYGHHFWVKHRGTRSGSSGLGATAGGTASLSMCSSSTMRAEGDAVKGLLAVLARESGGGAGEGVDGGGEVAARPSGYLLRGCVFHGTMLSAATSATKKEEASSDENGADSDRTSPAAPPSPSDAFTPVPVSSLRIGGTVAIEASTLCSVPPSSSASALLLASPLLFNRCVFVACGTSISHGASPFFVDCSFVGATAVARASFACRILLEQRSDEATAKGCDADGDGRLSAAAPLVRQEPSFEHIVFVPPSLASSSSSQQRRSLSPNRRRGGGSEDDDVSSSPLPRRASSFTARLSVGGGSGRGGSMTRLSSISGGGGSIAGITASSSSSSSGARANAHEATSNTNRVILSSDLYHPNVEDDAELLAFVVSLQQCTAGTRQAVAEGRFGYLAASYGANANHRRHHYNDGIVAGTMVGRAARRSAKALRYLLESSGWHGGGRGPAASVSPFFMAAASALSPTAMAVGGGARPVVANCHFSFFKRGVAVKECSAVFSHCGFTRQRQCGALVLEGFGGQWVDCYWWRNVGCGIRVEGKMAARSVVGSDRLRLAKALPRGEGTYTILPAIVNPIAVDPSAAGAPSANAPTHAHNSSAFTEEDASNRQADRSHRVLQGAFVFHHAVDAHCLAAPRLIVEGLTRLQEQLFLCNNNLLQPSGGGARGGGGGGSIIHIRGGGGAAGFSSSVRMSTSTNVYYGGAAASTSTSTATPYPPPHYTAAAPQLPHIGKAPPPSPHRNVSQQQQQRTDSAVFIHGDPLGASVSVRGARGGGVGGGAPLPMAAPSPQRGSSAGMLSLVESDGETDSEEEDAALGGYAPRGPTPLQEAVLAYAELFTATSSSSSSSVTLRYVDPPASSGAAVTATGVGAEQQHGVPWCAASHLPRLLPLGATETPYTGVESDTRAKGETIALTRHGMPVSPTRFGEGVGVVVGPSGVAVLEGIHVLTCELSGIVFESPLSSMHALVAVGPSKGKGGAPSAPPSFTAFAYSSSIPPSPTATLMRGGGGGIASAGSAPLLVSQFGVSALPTASPSSSYAASWYASPSGAPPPPAPTTTAASSVSASFQPSTQSVAKDCVVHSCGGYGIVVREGVATSVEMSRLALVYNGHAGLFVEGSLLSSAPANATAHATLSMSRCDGNGIGLITKGDRLEVTRCNFEGNAVCGARLLDGSHCSLAKCRVVGNGNGVEVFGSIATVPHITACDITANRSCGVVASGGARPIVKQSSVWGHADVCGMMVRCGAKPFIEGCRVYDNAAGIVSRLRGEPTVSDCLIARNTTAGTVVEWGGEGLWRRNTFTRNASMSVLSRTLGKGTFAQNMFLRDSPCVVTTEGMGTFSHNMFREPAALMMMNESDGDSDDGQRWTASCFVISRGGNPTISYTRFAFLVDASLSSSLYSASPTTLVADAEGLTSLIDSALGDLPSTYEGFEAAYREAEAAALAALERQQKGSSKLGESSSGARLPLSSSQQQPKLSLSLSLSSATTPNAAAAAEGAEGSRRRAPKAVFVDAADNGASKSSGSPPSMPLHSDRPRRKGSMVWDRDALLGVLASRGGDDGITNKKSSSAQSPHGRSSDALPTIPPIRIEQGGKGTISRCAFTACGGSGNSSSSPHAASVVVDGFTTAPLIEWCVFNGHVEVPRAVINTKAQCTASGARHASVDGDAPPPLTLMSASSSAPSAATATPAAAAAGDVMGGASMRSHLKTSPLFGKDLPILPTNADFPFPAPYSILGAGDADTTSTVAPSAPPLPPCAVLVRQGASPTITLSLFSANAVGVRSVQSSPSIRRCHFTDNTVAGVEVGQTFAATDALLRAAGGGGVGVTTTPPLFGGAESLVLLEGPSTISATAAAGASPSSILSGDDARRWPEVSMCSFINNKRYGAFIHPDGRCDVTKCTIVGSGAAGVYGAANSAPMVKDCTLFENGLCGVVLHTMASGAAVANCKVYGGAMGLLCLASKGSEAMVEGCEVVRAKGAGIVLRCDAAQEESERAHVWALRNRGELGGAARNRARAKAARLAATATAVNATVVVAPPTMTVDTPTPHDTADASIADSVPSPSPPQQQPSRYMLPPSYPRQPLVAASQVVSCAHGLVCEGASCLVKVSDVDVRHTSDGPGVLIRAAADPLLVNVSSRWGRKEGVAIDFGGRGTLERCTIQRNHVGVRLRGAGVVSAGNIVSSADIHVTRGGVGEPVAAGIGGSSSTGDTLPPHKQSNSAADGLNDDSAANPPSAAAAVPLPPSSSSSAAAAAAPLSAGPFLPSGGDTWTMRLRDRNAPVPPRPLLSGIGVCDSLSHGVVLEGGSHANLTQCHILDNLNGAAIAAYDDTRGLVERCVITTASAHVGNDAFLLTSELSNLTIAPDDSNAFKKGLSPPYRGMSRRMRDEEESAMGTSDESLCARQRQGCSEALREVYDWGNTFLGNLALGHSVHPSLMGLLVATGVSMGSGAYSPPHTTATSSSSTTNAAAAPASASALLPRAADDGGEASVFRLYTVDVISEVLSRLATFVAWCRAKRADDDDDGGDVVDGGAIRVAAVDGLMRRHVASLFDILMPPPLAAPHTHAHTTMASTVPSPQRNVYATSGYWAEDGATASSAPSPSSSVLHLSSAPNACRLVRPEWARRRLLKALAIGQMALDKASHDEEERERVCEEAEVDAYVPRDFTALGSSGTPPSAAARPPVAGPLSATPLTLTPSTFTPLLFGDTKRLAAVEAALSAARDAYAHYHAHPFLHYVAVNGGGGAARGGATFGGATASAAALLSTLRVSSEGGVGAPTPEEIRAAGGGDFVLVNPCEGVTSSLPSPTSLHVSPRTDAAADDGSDGPTIIGAACLAKNVSIAARRLLLHMDACQQQRVVQHQPHLAAMMAMRQGPSSSSASPPAQTTGLPRASSTAKGSLHQHQQRCALSSVETNWGYRFGDGGCCDVGGEGGSRSDAADAYLGRRSQAWSPTTAVTADAPFLLHPNRFESTVAIVSHVTGHHGNTTLPAIMPDVGTDTVPSGCSHDRGVLMQILPVVLPPYSLLGSVAMSGASSAAHGNGALLQREGRRAKVERVLAQLTTRNRVLEIAAIKEDGEDGATGGGGGGGAIAPSSVAALLGRGGVARNYNVDLAAMADTSAAEVSSGAIPLLPKLPLCPHRFENPYPRSRVQALFSRQAQGQRASGGGGLPQQYGGGGKEGHSYSLPNPIAADQQRRLAPMVPGALSAQLFASPQSAVSQHMPVSHHVAPPSVGGIGTIASIATGTSSSATISNERLKAAVSRLGKDTSPVFAWQAFAAFAAADRRRAGVLHVSDLARFIEWLCIIYRYRPPPPAAAATWDGGGATTAVAEANGNNNNYHHVSGGAEVLEGEEGEGFGLDSGGGGGGGGVDGVGSIVGGGSSRGTSLRGNSLQIADAYPHQHDGGSRFVAFPQSSAITAGEGGQHAEALGTSPLTNGDAPPPAAATATATGADVDGDAALVESPSPNRCGDTDGHRSASINLSTTVSGGTTSNSIFGDFSSQNPFGMFDGIGGVGCGAGFGGASPLAPLAAIGSPLQQRQLLLPVSPWAARLAHDAFDRTGVQGGRAAVGGGGLSPPAANTASSSPQSPVGVPSAGALGVGDSGGMQFDAFVAYITLSDSPLASLFREHFTWLGGSGGGGGGAAVATV